MSCAERREGLIEMARGGVDDAALWSHCQTCHRCQAFLEAQLRLTATAASLMGGEPPPALEAALLAEFTRVRPARKPWWVAAPAAAVIAASIVAGWMAQRPSPSAPPPVAIVRPTVPRAAGTTPLPVARRPIRRTARPRPAPVHVAADTTPEPEQPFIAIPYTAPLAPYERADVMRVDLPVSALIAAGVPVEVSDPSAHARADLIVSEDGRARAVRLISISDRSYQQ